MKEETIAITIRKIPLSAHKRLKLLAKNRGHSAEAEIRDLILRHTEINPVLGNLGDELVALGKRLGGMELDVSRATESFRDLGLE